MLTDELSNVNANLIDANNRFIEAGLNEQVTKTHRLMYRKGEISCDTIVYMTNVMDGKKTTLYSAVTYNPAELPSSSVINAADAAFNNMMFNIGLGHLMDLSRNASK